MAVFVNVPAKPVKFRFLNPPVAVNATMSVPALTFKLIEFASDKAPNDKVRVPVAPLYVVLTTGVPETLKFVAVAVVQIVAAFPVSVMLLVPNATTRVRAPLELNNPVLNR